MIVYMHGFLGCPDDWGPLCDKLPGPHQTLILPGHDNCPLPDDINSYLAQKITKPVTLIGYSLGGRLALDFATQFPKLVKNLIILSANPGIDDPKQRQERLKWDQAWCDVIEQQGFPTFLERWYEQPLFHSLRNSPNFDATLKKRLQHNPEFMKEVFLKLSPAILPSRWSAIQKFSFPSLFLFGEHDIKYQSIRNNLVKLGVSTDLIPHSGHAIHLENPEACAAKIKEFLCL